MIFLYNFDHLKIVSILHVISDGLLLLVQHLRKIGSTALPSLAKTPSHFFDHVVIHLTPVEFEFDAVLSCHIDNYTEARK